MRSLASGLYPSGVTRTPAHDGSGLHLFLLEGRRQGGDWTRYPVVFTSLEEVEHALQYVQARSGDREYRIVGVILEE
ncbi:MAG TPA: hypothetical protein VL172_10240 [Kofleriaceae bacterium]|nr:hypothetical protein [Kofleriaceae bacterium]